MPAITVEYLVEKIKALHEAGKINFITKNNLLKRVTKFGVYDGIVEEIEKHGAVVIDEAHTMPDPSRPSIPPEQNLPQSTAGTVTNFSVADELGKLKALLDNGTITQDEFAAQKARLLETQRSQSTVIAPPQPTVPPTKKKKGHGCAILVLLLLVGFVTMVAITPSKHENSSPSSSGTSQHPSPKPTISSKDKKIILTEGDKYFLTETADTITLGYKHVKFEDDSRPRRKGTRYSINVPAEFLDLSENVKKEITKTFRTLINKDAEVFTLYAYPMPSKYDSVTFIISYAPDKKGHSGKQDWEWDIKDYSKMYKEWEKHLSATPEPLPTGPIQYIPLLPEKSSEDKQVTTPTPIPTPNEKPGDEISAWVMAQEFVKNSLKAPSTAKFPWFDAKQIRKVDMNIWVVNSYVDAQNSYGAMLRINYRAKVMYIGDDRWKLLDLKMDE